MILICIDQKLLTVFIRFVLFEKTPFEGNEARYNKQNVSNLKLRGESLKEYIDKAFLSKYLMGSDDPELMTNGRLRLDVSAEQYKELVFKGVIRQEEFDERQGK